LAEYPEGLVSVVADSYDLFNFLDNVIGDELKSTIEARKGVFVVRPDSGDPATIILQAGKHDFKIQYCLTLTA
jgi:nicotinamide phosphoribosyltransferase